MKLSSLAYDLVVRIIVIAIFWLSVGSEVGGWVVGEGEGVGITVGTNAKKSSNPGDWSTVYPLKALNEPGNSILVIIGISIIHSLL